MSAEFIKMISELHEERFNAHLADIVKNKTPCGVFFSFGLNFSPVMKHSPEIYSVYEMLGSDESKKVFRAVIKGRLTGRVSEYRFAPEPQYFLKGFYPSARITV